MKHSLWVFMLFLSLQSCDIFHEVARTVESEMPLTEQEVVKGLKEALRVSTDTAVLTVSAINGYYGDPRIRISLPPDADVILDHRDHPLLKAVGITNLIDDAERAVNRAAEDAAKKASPIFVKAITSMSIQDAFDILNGPDTAATHYFRKKTYRQLESTFRPSVKNSLDKPLLGKVSANEAWSGLTEAYNNIAGFAGWKKVNSQLDVYVTRKALNGLFQKLAAEETAIRKDPRARVTAILEKVFGKQ